MIKKILFTTAALLISTSFIANTTVFASDGEKPSIQLLVSGVIGYAYNKDMGDAVDAIGEDYILSNPGYKGIETTMPYIPVGFDLDFRYFFDSFGIGLQVGSHAAVAETEAKGSSVPKYTATYTLSVIPVVATLFYRFDSDSSNSFVLLGGGVGYYFGTMKVEGVSWAGDFNQSKIGFHALVEYDYAFDFGLTLFAGVKGRYLKFNEFKDGSNVMRNVDGSKFKAGLTGVVFYFGTGFSF
ncbi:MAG: hypothetical protein FWG49_07330 [Leptospirales bacterium]|nr:hypothetical protein [Leptospirales bacterium]